MITALWLFLLTLAGAGVATGLARSFALRQHIMDVPNERSSHTKPVPRGGGVGIVAVVLASVLVLSLLGHVGSQLALALILGGTLVAAVGWIDDRRHVPAPIRAAVHLTAASMAVILLGGPTKFHLGGASLEGGWIVMALAAIAIVWLINLYNFMDGIDGLAGGEALTVAATAAILLILGGFFSLGLVAAVVAGAGAGFLLWNWPPAKVFMGDVGSGFLGFLFGTLAASSMTAKPSSFWTWLILLGVFFTDTLITLVRRMVRGEKWYEAHRSHAFQHATARTGSHLKVTAGVLALNLLWLTPLACIAWSQPGLAPLCAAVALTPLVLLALCFRAGLPQEP